MKMRMLGVLFCGLLTSTALFAGDARGNGGHGIVCRSSNGQVVSVEILDFYEAREYRGIQRDLGPQSLTVEEKIRMALARVSRFEFRGERYLKAALEFEQNALFKSGVTLVNVPDTNHLAFPKGCAVEQVINQRQTQFPEDKLYLVNADLWNLLDNDNKAAFILHEVIFGELISEGQTTSEGARYFNSYITARKTDDWIYRNSYFDLLRRSGFKDYWWHNLPLEFPDPLLCSEGGCSVKKGIWWKSKVSKPVQVNIGPTPLIAYYTFIVRRDCALDLYPNGNIREGCFEVPRDLSGSSSFAPEMNHHLWFNEGGRMIGRELHSNHQNSFPAGLSGWIEAKSIIWFYDSGKVRSANLKEAHTVATATGPQLLPANSIVEFDETGLATKWFTPK